MTVRIQAKLLKYSYISSNALQQTQVLHGPISESPLSSGEGRPRASAEAQKDISAAAALV